MKPAILVLAILALSAVEARAEDPHIAVVERDIEPPVQVRGQPVPHRTLAETMAAAHVPAISVAVIDHGRIAWAKAWGVADVASGARATPRTPFQAGSVSKPVFASVVMQLVQAGKLDLDRAVNDQLTSWKLPDSPLTEGDPVTLRHLLAHTGGLTVHGFPGYEAGRPVPTLVEVLNGQPPANTKPVVVERKPGTAWTYSGGGISVAQLMVEDRARQPLPTLAEKGVFAPLDMADSTYEQPLDRSWIAAHSPATGYHDSGQPVPGRFHTYPEMAAAGLWTTPTDLAKWAIALQDAYAGRPSPLMSQASARVMLTPGLGRWGLGISVLGEGETLRFGHGGDDDGFKTELVGYMNEGRGVVIMGNGDAALQLLGPIEQAVARAYGWPGLGAKMIDAVPIDAAQAQTFVGSYRHGEAMITLIGVTLLVAADNQRSELIPIGPDRFILKSDGATLVFARGADGKVAKLQVHGSTLDRDP